MRGSIMGTHTSPPLRCVQYIDCLMNNCILNSICFLVTYNEFNYQNTKLQTVRCHSTIKYIFMYETELCTLCDLNVNGDEYNV